MSRKLSVNSQEGVAFPLPSNRCGRPVPGKDDDAVIQDHEFSGNSLEQKLAIAAGQVPSPDAIPEEHITADQRLIVGHMEAQAPRTMAGNQEDPELRAQKIDGAAFIEKEIRLEWLDFQLEPPAPEKIRVRNHGRRVGMKGGLAAMPPDDCRCVGHMVEMTVGQEKQINAVSGKRLVRALRSIKEDVSPGGMMQKTVGVQHSAGKRFEPIHKKVV